MTKETKPDEIPQDPNLCIRCQKDQCIAEYGYLCQKCYDDGWRAGQEMIDAFRNDPQFTIDDEGKIGVVPDYKEKWSKP
jgi:hypothetical protein